MKQALVGVSAQLLFLTATFANGTGTLHKIQVNNPSLARRLAAGGAAEVADYGSFQLYEVDGAAPALAATGDVQDRDDYYVIQLNSGSLDTRVPSVMARRQALAPFSGRRCHLVQFAGPVTPAWHKALLDTGIEVVFYIPQNAYLVRGDSAALNALRQWAAAAGYVQWEAAYRGEDKIHARAREQTGPVKSEFDRTDLMTIQLVADEDDNPATLALIDQLKLAPVLRQDRFQKFVNVIARIPRHRLAELADRPDVVSIQPYVVPEKFCERQDQIIAGNLSGGVPDGPGYLAWITGFGFNQSQFTVSDFAVDLTDSGVDNGTNKPFHFGLYVGGNTNAVSRILYNRLEGTPNGGSTIQGCDGHGTINAHIIAGYNDLSGFPHADADGFRYGLGLCPFVQVGSSVIFDPNNYTFPNFENLQSKAYRDKARLSSNSWGANTAGAYNSDSQRYDALVRDAQPSGSTVPTAGNQEMVIIFAAGNAGPAAQTVGSPGTAKNVFTIGAAENVQAFGGNDGCGIGDSGADNANDIISFSSRGPCADGRKKPEIVAPGTHVSGGVAQIANPGTLGTANACFNGGGVCGGVGINFFPSGQQFYTASSGTSHSTPAAAGVCALLRQFFINNSLPPPSPAMTKAFLINSARYLTGVGANDTLWSNNQGMGELNLKLAFGGDVLLLRDQVAADKFTATGQTRTFTGSISDSNKLFRVTLAWTDAPGSTSGNAYNNDLDLTVTAAGNTYKGNVFSGRFSVTGGSADPRNNVESVFLPPGVSGVYTVTVTAANINSDGVPNDADPLDQDFSLVVASRPTAPEVVAGNAALLSESCLATNGAIDPGETVAISFPLRNIGNAEAPGVTATLLPTGGVTAPSGPQSYGALGTNGAPVSQTFSFTASGSCGGTITATLLVQTNLANFRTVRYNFTLGGFNTMFAENFDGVSAPALPAGWTATNTAGASPLWVTSSTGVPTPAADTSPNAALVDDPGTISDKRLDSPAIPIASVGAKLTFRNNYSLETGFDGGVLEISIGGGAFQDILAAGGSFAAGGYTYIISSSYGSPISGRQAWSGDSGGFVTTTVNLPAAAAGQNIRLRWRMGSDNSVAGQGWRIDTVTIGDVVCCTNAGTPDPFLAWQLQYFGCTNCPQADANADPLGKGMSNTNQFLAGFDPTNPDAALRIVNIVRTNDDVRITYLGANGNSTVTPPILSRTNVLEFATGTGNGSYSNNFASTGQTNILSGGNGSGVVTNLTDFGGAVYTSRFYRVRVLAP
jgi:hypothetical protein